MNVKRFWDKVVKTEGCWEWAAAKDSSGYGRFHVRVGKLEGAHRFSWELTHGPIPSGLSVLHRCDNRRCVNPGHLFLGTHAENMQDMKAKGRAAVETAHRTKLSRQEVDQVRQLAAQGYLQRHIGDQFGISQKQVSRIVSGENWK